MTIKELAKEWKAPHKLMRAIARIAGIPRDNNLTDTDIRIIEIALAAARDKNIQRQIICRYSRKQKQDIIRTAGLSDRLEVWLYSRMEGIMNTGRRVRLNDVLHEASKFFSCNITPALRHKAKKVRQLLRNRRNYERRKMVTVLQA